MINRITKALVIAALLLANASFAAPLKVLILSGANNHDWHKTTPALGKILKDSGRFSMDVETNVPGMKPDSFAPYDAVLSNFNMFGQKNPGAIWNADVRAAFEKFIRSGHRHNAKAMESDGFRILLQRGTEWAASAKVSK